MMLAGPADYLFSWQIPLILLYVAVWLIGGTYLTHWALARMTELPRRKRTSARSLRLNFFTTGSGLTALTIVAGSFGVLAGRAEGHKATIAVVGLSLGVPAMFGTAWAVGMVMLDLPVKTWLRITGVTTGALLAFLALLVAGAFLPARSQRLTKHQQDRCRSNLYELQAALNRHSTLGPEAVTLEELVMKGRCGPEVLRCPANPNRPQGYLYAPSPQAERDTGASDKIRVCDHRKNHSGCRMVLYTDGRVEVVNEDRFSELLELLENAEMAELVRAEK